MTEAATTAPPTPSLLSSLLPMIRELDDFLGQSATAVDRLMLWDSRTVNHEPLLSCMNELTRTHEQFLATISAKLQSLWLRESQRYSNYVRALDRTLRVRHAAELENAFPRLRMSPAAMARAQHELASGNLRALDDVSADESIEGIPVRDVVVHLAQHGFEYDQSCRRLILLVLRQLRENKVLKTTSMQHMERLTEAKRTDLQRLDRILRRSSTAVEALVSGTQRKITASRNASMAASAVYMGGGGASSSVAAIANKSTIGGAAASSTLAASQQLGASASGVGGAGMISVRDGAGAVGGAGGGAFEPRPPSAPRGKSTPITA